MQKVKLPRSFYEVESKSITGIATLLKFHSLDVSFILADLVVINKRHNK